MARHVGGRAANAVARRIEDRGTTPSTVARRAGISPKTMLAFLRGDRWPTVATQRRIEAALGWPSGEIDLIGRDGNLDGLETWTVAQLQEQVANCTAELARRARGA